MIQDQCRYVDALLLVLCPYLKGRRSKERTETDLKHISTGLILPLGTSLTTRHLVETCERVRYPHGAERTQPRAKL